MPKLKDHAIDRNRRKIEEAASRVFIRQGYHGTSVRDIADASGVSVGNIYNYYHTKEHLFAQIVRRYEARMDQLRAETLNSSDNLFEPEGLQQLARGVRRIVYDNPDYWRLMYIDVVEFGNRHFAHTFRHLSRNMADRLGERLAASTRGGRWNGIEPALAFTAIYLQFFTYFLVEKLFGGKQHLGVPDEQAVAQIIRMVTEGLWREGPPARGRQAKGTKR